MPPRVLIVEDHDDLAEALEVNLKRDGYDTAIAWDGHQALETVRRIQPDVIILDLGLRGLDGFGVLERLRADGCWSPVLILSARDADTDKVEGFRLGADDYVTKPFRTLELLARVGALARRALRDRAEAAGNGAPMAEAPIAPEPAGIPFTNEQLMEEFGLTLRQAEVARLLADGLSNPEIADALSISRFTARNHAEQVLAKLRVSSRGRAAAVLRSGVRTSTPDPM